MAHEPDECFYCEHGLPCNRRPLLAPKRPTHGPGGVPAKFNDDYVPHFFDPDWRPGCMCDFEGHTRTGCTHDT